MKHWAAVVWIAAAAMGLTWMRRAVRDHIVGWSAQRAQGGAASARRRALLMHGTAALLAVILIVVGLWAWNRGGSLAWVRYPIALAVLLGYLPAAMVAAPKLTKWQKSHEQRLILSGAAREGARGWDSVARVFSVVGVLLGFVALFLLVVPT